MTSEIVSVGTELLLGEITDTNATYISQRMAEIGVDVYFRHTVGDNLQRIVSVLELALSRCDLVLVCGGLGPTQDDLTREAISEATGRALRPDAVAEARLRDFFGRRGYTLSSSNLKQAMCPEGGRLLANSCGTAPGILLELEDAMRPAGKALIAVPGPPPEMREMMQRQVLPWLRARQGEEAAMIRSRVLRLCDIGESAVAAEIDDILSGQTDPTVAPYASPGEVKLRIATKANSEEEATRKLDEMECTLRERLKDYVYGVDEDTMEVAIGKALAERGATLAIAESCTGGLVASRVTDVPGSSRYFVGGVVAYSNDIKRDVLGVSAEVLEEFGAVSEQCARAMAEGVRELYHADFALATTGIAGPEGGTKEKPVGLVYIAVADEEGTICAEHQRRGTRDQFKQRVAQMALNILRKRVLGIAVERN